MADNNTPDLSGMIQTLMSNPELMSKITGALGTQNAEKASSSPNTDASPKRQTDHSKLLAALKPYLGETRRDNVDTVIKLMSALELAQASGLLSLKRGEG